MSLNSNTISQSILNYDTDEKCVLFFSVPLPPLNSVMFYVTGFSIGILKIHAGVPKPFSPKTIFCEKFESVPRASDLELMRTLV